jgi:hypothetical protein
VAALWDAPIFTGTSAGYPVVARSTRGRSPARAPGYPRIVIGKLLYRGGLRGWQLHAASLSSVALCLGLWIRAKTVDQNERGNAERRAMFVGFWPPMFWLMGDAVERHKR